METALLIFNIILMMSCVSISYLFKEHYPKDINSLIGYRTRRSMASKEAWLFANKHSSALLFNYSIITTGVQVVVFVLMGSKPAILSALSIWVLFLFTTIIQTEIKLKRLF